MARILHICSSANFAQYVDKLLPAIADAGHEVHFVSAPGPEPQKLLDDRIHLHTIPIRRAIEIRADLQALASLTRLLRSLRPHLVHAHTPKGGLVGMLAARAAGVPARVYQVHGVRYETARGLRRDLLHGCERLSVSLAHRVICVSPSVRNRLMDDGVVSQEKSRVFSFGSAQGIHVGDFDPSGYEEEAQVLRERFSLRSDPCVAYLGRLARDKGLEDLLEAWRHVTRERPDAHLIVAGNPDPSDPPDLTAASALDNVHIIEHLEDPKPLLRIASVVVLPSLREGLPQTILEAGAMETPVVATRVTGVVDAIEDRESGLLTAPRDALGLARQTLHLLQSEREAHALGRAGRRLVAERFSFEPILTETLQTYEQMLSD